MTKHNIQIQTAGPDQGQTPSPVGMDWGRYLTFYKLILALYLNQKAIIEKLQGNTPEETKKLWDRLTFIKKTLRTLEKELQQE